MTVLAVDGDALAFRVAAVCEEEMAQACNDLIDGMLQDMASVTGATRMRVYLGGDDNFRYKIAVTKPYKGNRDGLKKPQHLPYARDYLVKNYRAIIVHGYEADDAIASDMRNNGAVHSGLDKDLYQVAGRHYNFVTKESIFIDDSTATINFYRQILTGDSADNIPGLPMVGEKTAEKIITSAETAMQDAKNYYKEICANKMPEIDVAAYWKEQVQLIELIKTLNVLDLMTNKVKINLF